MTTEIIKPTILHPNSREGVVIICDHATNHIPEGYENLGLEAKVLDSHIGWDIGAADVARCMSFMMDVPAIFAPTSRLLIDCNRHPDHTSLVPHISDGTIVPANQQLSDSNINNRKAAYYDPFHNALDDIISDHVDEGHEPLVIGLHSFTPTMDGIERPWQIGFMWDEDPRLAQAMIGLIERETDLVVGVNQPYSGKDLYYTMQRHGADHGLPQTVIEIRSDLITEGEGMIRQWAALLADCMDECMSRDDVF